MEIEIKNLWLPLCLWYEREKRDLPWRRTKDPYAVWVSEIMLQQTRVEAVKPYYARFLQTLPTIRDLAEAEEELLLKLWEGLGYYSRVRNMQAAAKQVMAEYGGSLPADYKSLLSLKGIGSYTAGAVASIAFSLPFAAVDGNVLRVMSRIFADDRDILLPAVKKDWEKEISEALTKENAGTVNQALMELGATICLPKGEPKCFLCPMLPMCRAYRKGKIAQFPVKGQKKPRTIVHLNVFFLTDGKRIALRKRPKKGLLANLWELPNGRQEESFAVMLQEWGIKKGSVTPMQEQKHIFTHVEWRMTCYFVLAEEREDTPFIWIEPEKMQEAYALPSAFKKIWEEGISFLDVWQNEKAEILK